MSSTPSPAVGKNFNRIDHGAALPDLLLFSP